MDDQDIAGLVEHASELSNVVRAWPHEAGMAVSDTLRELVRALSTLQAERDAARADHQRLLNDREQLLGEADAELVRLQGRVAKLTATLEPFAAYLDTAAFDLDNLGRPLPDNNGVGWVYLTVGDFRRARAALTDTPGESHG